MSFVQILYKGKRFNLTSDFASLLDLTKRFRSLAKITDSKQVTTFVYFDPQTGSNCVILSDGDLHLLQRIPKEVSAEQHGIVHLTVLGSHTDEQEQELHNITLLERSISSEEVELIEHEIPMKKESKKKVVAAHQKQEAPADDAAEINSINEKDDSKRKKNTDKIKKLISKEFERQLPSLIESAKSLVLEQLREKCPGARARLASQPVTSSSIPAASSSSNITHLRVSCDGCGAHPIIGIRYKCVKCADYDLCEKCEESGVHSHHAFVKIRKPELAPQMLVTVEADQEAQDLIDRLPAEARHRVLDVDFNSLFGTFNSAAMNQQRQSAAQAAESHLRQKSEKKRKNKEEKRERKLLEAQILAATKADSKKPLTQTEIIASIVGGNPADYEEICAILQSNTNDEIVQYIFENDLFSESRNKPFVSAPVVIAPVVVAPVVVAPVVVPASTSSSSTPSGDSTSDSTAVSTPTGESSSTPQPEESLESKEVFTAKLIASILDDNEAAYEKYIAFVRENSSKSLDEILYTAMTNPIVSVAVVAPAVAVSAPVVVPKPAVVVAVESPVEKYPSALKKKAEQVAEIMGGSFTDYIDGILNLPCKATVQQIIDSILSQDLQQIRKAPVSSSSQKPEEIAPQRKVSFKEEVAAVIPAVIPKQEKVLRKKFSILIQKKATEIASILGESPELYYGVVDTYCLSTVNELIEIILNNSNVTTQFSSYKNQ